MRASLRPLDITPSRPPVSTVDFYLAVPIPIIVGDALWFRFALRGAGSIYCRPTLINLIPFFSTCPEAMASYTHRRCLLTENSSTASANLFHGRGWVVLLRGLTAVPFAGLAFA